MTLEIEIDNWRLNFDLYIGVEKLGGGGEIEIGDGPGPKLDIKAISLKHSLQ